VFSGKELNFLILFIQTQGFKGSRESYSRVLVHPVLEVLNVSSSAVRVWADPIWN
jgi:hypothetical protein